MRKIFHAYPGTREYRFFQSGRCAIRSFIVAVCVLAGSLPEAAHGQMQAETAVTSGEDIEIQILESPVEAAAAISESAELVDDGEIVYTPEWSLFSDSTDHAPQGGETSSLLNRIVVRTDGTLGTTYGAEKGYYYTVGEEYILEYGDRDAAEYAFEMLSRQYGEDSVFQDELVSLKDMDAEVMYSGLADTETGEDAAFDGIRAMGLDVLKEQAETNWDGEATVAVIDSGIDMDHPWFQGRLDENSTYLSGNTLNDFNGHGTHVAGIIEEATPSSVKILAVRVFDDLDNSTLVTIRFGIDYAVEKGADVINLSLGDNFSSKNEKNLVDSALAKAVGRGCVVCAAAGNEYGSVENCYPASSYWTIAVGALKEISKGIYTWDNYSNKGTLLDFTAPGTNIVSAWNDGTTKSQKGTSMSCPHISAAAAMIKFRHPEYNQWDVYASLQDFSVDLGAPGKDEYYGYGYVNLAQYYEKQTEGYGELQYQSIQADAIVTKMLNDAPFTLNASVSIGDGMLSIRSSNEQIASVNGTTVTIHKAGTCELILTAGQTERYRETERRIQLVVNKLPQTLTVPQTSIIKTYSTVKFFLNATSSSGEPLSYVSSDPSVAVVGSNGQVTLKQSGTTVITVTAPESERYQSGGIKNITLTVKKATPALRVSGKTVSVTAKPFMLKAVNSGNGKLTYKSSNKKIAVVGKKGKITVKKVGSATITVKSASTAKYKAVSKKIKIKVIPAKTAIRKLSARKRGLTVSWKKKSGVTGYQIRYAKKSSMKNAKKAKVKGASEHSHTISGLKAKQIYYVQVRTYKKKTDKTFYSTWSAKKKIRTK